MNPQWLEHVLAENAHLNLDHADGRALMAEAIASALPKEVMVASILGSASAVLKMRGIRDGANDIAREIANNGAGAVLLMLQVGE